MGVFKRPIKADKGQKQHWYIRFRMNGKDKWESVGEVGIITKTIAQRRLEERKRQVELGQFDLIGANIPTIAEFENDYIVYIRDIKHNRSWKSALLYINTLKKFFRDNKLSQISAKDIDEYKLHRLKDVKPASLNRELACLSHLFNYARRQNKFFGENPVSISKLVTENNLKERIMPFISITLRAEKYIFITGTLKSRFNKELP